jgi:hypothetical protein
MSQKTYIISITKIIWLIMVRETIIIYFMNQSNFNDTTDEMS